MEDESSPGWYAVRCVFLSGRPPGVGGENYEERVTLWQARSAEHAVQRAEAEALEFASAVRRSPDRYLGIAQCFRLFDEPGDGAEVFSLVRTSDLSAEEYLDRFFDSGPERARHLKS